MNETIAAVRTSFVPESRPLGQCVSGKIGMSRNAGKQNVTISMSPETVRKARILAARRPTSISGLLADEIEKLVGAEEAWELPSARRGPVATRLSPRRRDSRQPRRDA